MKTPTWITPEVPQLAQAMTQNAHLAALITKAKQLIEIDKYFKEILTDLEIAEHCHVVNQQQGSLVIFVTSAAFRLRLQFMQKQLLARLQEKYPAIKNLELRIAPHNEEKTKQQKTVIPLSPESRAAIKMIAHSMRDARLKTALLCLSRED